MKRILPFGIFVALLSCTSLAYSQSNAVRVVDETQISAGEERSLQKFVHSRNREASKGFDFCSKKSERRMGERASVEFEARVKLLSNTGLTEYLAGIGRKLAAQSSANGTKIRFKVVDSDDVNAMALPNGVVYVNSGLFLLARSEAELAGVLAHEIAHLAARHAGRAATRRGMWGVVTFGMEPATGGVGAALEPAMGVAENGVLMKFGRDAEREADLLGLTYLESAGYDPYSYPSILKRMSIGEAERGAVAKVNATHPAGKDRVRRVLRAIELLFVAREDYVEDSKDFVSAKKTVIELTHPEMNVQWHPVLLTRPK
jgi:predicted Zn-dependent protease